MPTGALYFHYVPTIFFRVPGLYPPPEMIPATRSQIPHEPARRLELRVFLAHITLARKKDPFYMNKRNPIHQNNLAVSRNPAPDGPRGQAYP